MVVLDGEYHRPWCRVFIFLYQNEYVELATGNAHGVINGFDPIKSYQTFLCNDVSLNKWYCENTGR